MPSQTEMIVTVGPGRDYASISEALQRAPSGGTVLVYGGRLGLVPAACLAMARC